MYHHAPFRLIVLGFSLVLALAACSEDPQPQQQSFSLNVTFEGGGSVTLTTSDAAVPARAYQDSFEGSLAAGTRVTLTADPAEGFQFGAWGGDCDAEDPTCTFTLDTNQTGCPDLSSRYRATPAARKLRAYSQQRGRRRGHGDEHPWRHRLRCNLSGEL